MAGVVLAAGSSRRLGRPKQLLDYGPTTLLGATLERVRSFGLHPLVVTLGASEGAIRERIHLDGLVVATGEDHTEGCASSIRAAVAALESAPPDVDGLLLFLGDQPEVTHRAVDALLSAVAERPADDRPVVGVCRYRDGLGHPFWFAREAFGALHGLAGDKAVWKLIDPHHGEPLFTVVEVEVDELVPLDVDTDDDYRRLLAQEASAAPDGGE